MAAFDLQVLLSLVDNLTAPLRGPMASLQAIERQAQRVETGMSQMATGAGLMAASATIIAPLAMATNEAIKFESAMADVKKVVNFDTPAQLGEMRDDLMDLSDRIPMAAEGFAQIAAAAGQAGIAREEIVRFSEDAAKMGVAFDMAADQAGGAMTGLRTIFKLTQDDVVLLGDSVNHLSNNMDAKASNIVDILNRTGGTGKLIGMTGQQVAALGATFLALKKPPEVAATGINALLLKLSTAEQQAKPFQKGLESIGLTAEQLKGWMEDDAQAGVLRFLDTVRSSKDVIGTLGQLFGAEYADDIAALVGNMDTYRKALALSGDATAYAGSMNREFAARADTTENALKLLSNNAKNFGIVMGSIVAPTVRDVAEVIGRATRGLRSYAEAHPEAARRAVILTAGAAGLMIVLGMLLTTLGLMNIGVGQAVGGWGLLRAGWMRAQTTAVGLTARLVQLGAAARAANLSQQLALQQNATGMARFSLATSGAAIALRGAAASAWGFTAALLANPITWVVAAVVALGAAFVWAWRNSEQFRTTVIEATVPIQQAWEQLKASLASLGAALGPVGAAISNALGRFKGPLDAIGYGFGWLIGFILTGVVLLATRLATSFIDMFSGLVDIVTGAINLIVGLVTGDTEKMHLGVTQILGGLRRIWEATFLGHMLTHAVMFGQRFGVVLREWIGGAYAWLVGQLERWRTAGVQLAAGLVLGIIARIVGITTAVQTGVNNARAWLGSVVGSWRQAGADIVGGLIAGIKSRVGEAAQALAGLGHSALNGFKTFLGIHSPSRVFMAQGGFIVEGLALGITNTASNAVTASRRLALGVAAAGVVSLPAVAAPIGTVGGQIGGTPEASSSARVTSTGTGTTIVIQRLEVRTDDPGAFVKGLQALVEAHQ